MAANASPEQHLDHLLDLSTTLLDPGTPLVDRLGAALDRERRYLDLPYGFLTHIDQRADQQDIVLTSGTEGRIEEGETLPLSETYCRKTVETDRGRLTVEVASEEGWADDPAFKRFGLESYVGSAVEVDGDRRGTVCFASEAARQTPFDEFEVEVVALLARWASYELARRTGREPAEPVPDRLSSFLDGVDPSVVDTTFDLLANRTRRELLWYLATADGPTTVDEAAAHLANAGGIPGRSAARIEIALVHSHVPKLASEGVVTYDERTRELDYRPDDAIERVLGCVRPMEA
ncbi:winged helix-turn-helix domain-containing protein [Halorientalis pallida]|uniref:winged helix-turn-helix domain-containing protein n=1 Tax=Halorientalis pallida TaxID=2479928 RepID=UPI003C6EDD58